MDEWQIKFGTTYVDLISSYVDIWITCLVFKTTCIDRRIPLREGAFFLYENDVFFLRWIRGIRAIKARACVSLRRRHIGELGARCLSTISRGGVGLSATVSI